MKTRLCLLTLALLSAAAPAFAQLVARDGFETAGAWKPAAGVWKAAAGKFSQTDLAAGMARADRELRQAGVLEIEFDLLYNGGGFRNAGEAMRGRYHGGFGIHLGVDKSHPGKSWGNGRSYLLWINYDTEVGEGSEHYGLRAQVYDSSGPSKMKLMRDFNLEVLPVREALPLLARIAGQKAHIRLVVNTDTGEIRFYHPFDPGLFYFFYLEPKRLAGRWVSLRTNKLGVDFSDFKAARIR